MASASTNINLSGDDKVKELLENLKNVNAQLGQWIAIGRQTLIGDFSDIDLNVIIQHYPIHGLINAADLGSATGTYVAYMYALNVPIVDEIVIALIENNYPVMPIGMQDVVNRIEREGTL